MNFDLRPPLPPPRAEDLSRSHDSSGYPPELLRSVLSRMYCAAEILQLGTEARLASLVLFQRYYCAAETMQGAETAAEGARWHLGHVAASCLFLGCKSEEDVRRIRDCVNLAHVLDFAGIRGGRDDAEGYKGTGGATSCAADVDIFEAAGPPELDESYWKEKGRIVATEQEVLRVIQFDVSVGHPHRAVLLILDGMEWARQDAALVEETWMVLNDATFHAPALRHSIFAMACGAIMLSVERMTADRRDLAIQPPPRWWSAMGMTDSQVNAAKKSLNDAAAGSL